jgi:hypothetical protein
MLFTAFSFARSFYYLSAYDTDVNFDISCMQAADRSFLNKTAETAGTSNTLTFMFPFLCVLPFSFSLFVDRSTRISDIVISRCGKRRYYFSKAAAAFTGGFLIFFIPIAVSTVLTNSFYSHSVIDLFDPNFSTLTAGDKEFLTMRDLMLEILLFSPVLAELLAAFLLSVYAGACAVFALALSCAVRRFAVLIFVPVFLLTKLFELAQSMIIADHGYTYFHIDPMKYTVISSDNPFYGRPYWLFAAEIAVILALSAAVLFTASRRDQLR